VGAPGVDFTPGFSKFLTCPSLACPRPSSRTNFPCPTPKIKNTTSNTYERYLPDRPTRRWCNAKVAAGGCWWQIRTLDVLGCAHTTAITRRTEINCDASIKFSTVVLKSLWKTNHETPHHSAMTWLNTLCTIEVQSKKNFSSSEINPEFLPACCKSLTERPNKNKTISSCRPGQTFQSRPSEQNVSFGAREFCLQPHSDGQTEARAPKTFYFSADR